MMRIMTAILKLVLNFERPIVTDIAIPTQIEIFKLKNLSHPFNLRLVPHS